MVKKGGRGSVRDLLSRLLRMKRCNVVCVAKCVTLYQYSTSLNILEFT